MQTFNCNISYAPDSDFGIWLTRQTSEQISKIVTDHYRSQSQPRISKPIDTKQEIERPANLPTTPGKSPAVTSNKPVDVGLEGEQSVIDVLSPIYELEIKNSHAGDMIAKRGGKSVLVEVKNYTSAVPYKEVEKFHADLDSNNKVSAGLFVSLRSQITKVSKSIHLTKRNHQYVVFLTNPSRDIVLSMINLLFEINEYRHTSSNSLLAEIDKLEDMRSNIVTSKLLINDMKSGFDKNISSLIQQVNILEYRFGESIRNLTSNVVTEEISGAGKDRLIDIIIEKFAESALAKNDDHKLYLDKFIRKFGLGDFTRNKTAITWSGQYSANVLKTKTTLCFPVDSLATEWSSKYSIKATITNGQTLIKADIISKNYPLFDQLVC